jgi:acyl-CoA reductase-like NAD-dependent aldehyde dehydrogenase
MTQLDLSGYFPRPDQIPAEYQLTEPLEQRAYLAGGELKPWTGAVQDVFSPVYVQTETGLQRQRIGSYPVPGAEEALAVLDAAVKAYDNGRGEWPTMPVLDRIACLEDFTRRMKGKKAEVVRLLMWEIGKSRTDSEKEFDRTVQYIYDTIDELKDIDRQNSSFQIEEGIIGQIRRSPLGVVLCMGPFNYPLNETYTMLIPALLMGNVVLFKPPKHGTLLHEPLLDAFRESFPPGVVNTVYGRGNTVIPGLIQSGRVNVLGLIGSSRVASDLKKMHPKANRFRTVLSLDAKNAGIVLDHADLDLAVRESMLGTLSFNGQRCTAIKILFVHESVVEAFLTKMSEAIRQLKLGMPWERGVQITPLPEPNKPAYLAECLQDAAAQGARVVNEHGGERVESLVFPALVYPVREGMKLYREEQFGPVIPVVPFRDVEEPIQYLITADHGQQVSIFGTKSEEIAHLVDQLVNQVSRVNLNAQCQRGPDTFPFTGRKDSAEGTLSVHDALRAFSIRTVVATKETAENKALVNEILTQNESNFLSTRYIL